MGLIDDDGVVLGEHPVVLDLGEQNTVGHQLDVGLLAHLIGKAHLVTHVVTEFGLHLLGNTGRHSAGCQTAWLGVADKALHSAPERQTDLGDLGGFARAGFPCNDHHLMLLNGLGDLSLLLAHRQVVRISDLGHSGQTGLIAHFGGCQISGDGLQHGGLFAFRQLLDPVQTAGKAASVEVHADRETAAQRLDRERQGMNSLNRCPEGPYRLAGSDPKERAGTVQALT